jgi:hypothetical protein
MYAMQKRSYDSDYFIVQVCAVGIEYDENTELHILRNGIAFAKRCPKIFRKLFLFLRTCAHGRFLAPAVKQPQWPIISWLCERTLKETMRSHIFLMIWCGQCERSQARGMCSVTTCFVTIL